MSNDVSSSFDLFLGESKATVSAAVIASVMMAPSVNNAATPREPNDVSVLDRGVFGTGAGPGAEEPCVGVGESGVGAGPKGP